jgi:hypothetical protein
MERRGKRILTIKTTKRESEKVNALSNQIEARSKLNERDEY